MKQEPCAFVPTKEAARQLRKLAGELRLMVDGEVQPVMIDDTRTISTFPSDQTEDFPVEIDTIRRTVKIPDLFFDFHNWHYIPAQTIGQMPTAGVYWLRLIVTATYDMTKAVGSHPPEASIGAPSFEWVPMEVSPENTSPYPPVSTSTVYRFFLLEVTDGVRTGTRSSRYIQGGPGEIPLTAYEPY